MVRTSSATNSPPEGTVILAPETSCLPGIAST